jgi:hypothetical protein
MELVFVEVIEGKKWVAEFQATSDFNLHVERESGSYITLSQRGTERGEYDTAWAKGMYEGQRVIDYDFGALVYPKYIKVTSGSNVLKAVVTCPDGEVTPIAVPKYEFVDLGLPSGTKWATTNLGATKPEEAGLYFAWGETEGYTAEDVASGKRIFDDSGYKFGSMNNYSKYNAVDGLTTLELVDDAAYYISDGLCKMPSEQNWEELVANATINTETLNGVKGSRITSTINGNSIFIPFGGQLMDTMLDGVNEYSFLRTNYINYLLPDYKEYFAMGVVVDSGNLPMINPIPRVVGASIRPIQN